MAIKTLIITILLFLTPLFGGAGHSHDVSKSLIKKNAKASLIKLVKQGKISYSWKGAELISAKRNKSVKKEWIVSFKNNKIDDLKKSVIFIYLSSYGKFKGANYNKK